MPGHEHHSNTSSLIPMHTDIDCIIRDIIKQWWVILLAAVAAALLAGAYRTITYTPRYTTMTTFAVGKSGFSTNLAYDNLRSAETMTTKFTQIANSSVLKKRVCEELGLSWFSAEVYVSTIPESNLMTMIVTADSPRTAYLISNEVMEQTIELTAEMVDQMAIKVLMAPSIPMAPSQPLETKESMKDAAIIGAAIMVCIFALLSYLKDTIKSPVEASSKLDTRLLASIYHENKYKTLSDKLHQKQFALNINNPAVSFSYVESIQMMATRVRSALENQNKQVVMVTSISENEGKSTVAANLALALNREGKRVVLIDCDFRKPSQYKIFDMNKEELETDGLTDQLLGKSKLKFHECGDEKRLWLMCNIKPFQNFLNHKTIDRMKMVIEQLCSKVDYIIIDTSPMALASDGEALADFVQSTLLVVQQDMIEAKYINDVLDRLSATNTQVLGCVLNNVRPGLFKKKSGYGSYYAHNYRYTRPEQQRSE